PASHLGERGRSPSRDRGRAFAVSQPSRQPLARKRPFRLDRLRREAEDARHLVDGQTGEEPQLDDPEDPRTGSAEKLERLVEGEVIDGATGISFGDLGSRQSLQGRLEALSAASAVDEKPSHRAGAANEEMFGVVELSAVER